MAVLGNIVRELDELYRSNRLQHSRWHCKSGIRTLHLSVTFAAITGGKVGAKVIAALRRSDEV
jgi:hypothetical protein